MYSYKHNKYLYKNNMIGGDDFFNNISFVHNPYSYENLISILKSGTLKMGSDVDKKKRNLSGGEPMDEIYMNIYFKDNQNPHDLHGLVFSSQLLKDYDLTINAGWRGIKIVDIKKNDNNKIKKEKINRVKKFLNDPTKILPKTLVNISPYIMLHEVLFFENIPIKKYLVGINNCGFDKKQNMKIKNILKKKKNVKY